ncbi:MAG: hypothetical protein ACKVPX_01545 [Myxococcaceae bacterium]
MRARLLSVSLLAFVVGCEFAPTGSTHDWTVATALAASPEMLELETAATRKALYRSMLEGALTEQDAGVLALFPLWVDEVWVAAPPVDSSVRLLDAPRGNGVAILSGLDDWSDEPRQALGGLSERVAASRAAQAMLSHGWAGLTQDVRVERAGHVPYAAALLGGNLLRINPVFLYLAAAGNDGL